MRNLLQINTSLFSAEGQSSRLAATFVEAWRTRHPEDRVVLRDLAAEPVPHLDAERFRAFGTPPRSVARRSAPRWRKATR
jgi:FMN-dependent NADH-azoreductase